MKSILFFLLFIVFSVHSQISNMKLIHYQNYVCSNDSLSVITCEKRSEYLIGDTKNKSLQLYGYSITERRSVNENNSVRIIDSTRRITRYMKSYKKGWVLYANLDSVTKRIMQVHDNNIYFKPSDVLSKKFIQKNSAQHIQDTMQKINELLYQAKERMINDSTNQNYWVVEFTNNGINYTAYKTDLNTLWSLKRNSEPSSEIRFFDSEWNQLLYQLLMRLGGMESYFLQVNIKNLRLNKKGI